MRSALALGAALGLLAFQAGCSAGREAKLQEVLRRSRAAPERVVELEAPYLKDQEPDVRALAAWAIGESEAPTAAATLTEIAGDSAPSVRLAVARALCKLGGEPALAPLTQLAMDEDNPTRRVAVRCLASTSSPPPGVLARALADGDDEIRKIALAALALKPQPESLDPLLTVLSSRDAGEQLAAVAAIRALGSPRALPGLERAAAAHLTPTVRDAVEGAILDLRAVKAESERSASALSETTDPGVEKK